MWLDVRVSDPFPPRVEQSLARAMPATLELHAELWRRRQGWFDRMETGFDGSLRLRYDVALATYRLERAGAPPLFAPTLDSLRALLARPIALPVSRVGTMDASRRYYAVVTVTLKPLNIEDVAEMDDWFSGELQEKRDRGLGAVTELPVALFDAVRNFAGFGDQRARAQTADFDLESVFGGR